MNYEYKNKKLIKKEIYLRKASRVYVDRKLMPDKRNIWTNITLEEQFLSDVYLTSE